MKGSVILVLFTLLMGHEVCGQEQFDKSGFGVNLGFVYGQSNLTTNLPDYSEEKLWTQGQGGLSFGLLYYHKLDARIGLKTQLNLTFLDNFMVYESADGTALRKQIFPVFMELPIHFHFTNKADNNNISILFGIKISKSLNTGLDQELILKDSFSSAEFGLGKEFVFNKLTFAPEITYSFGLENLYRYSTLPQFSDYIEHLVLNQLAIKVLIY